MVFFKVHRDIDEAGYEIYMTVLIIIDLSPAFSGIDHGVLLEPVEVSFDIKKRP